MDRIVIEDLVVRCTIGITPEERREKQDVSISVSLYADLQPAARSDRFEEAVDYRAIKKGIVRLVEGSELHLLEALAERIAALCLEDPRILRAQVRVDKPGALRFARSVAVVIERTRDR